MRNNKQNLSSVGAPGVPSSRAFRVLAPFPVAVLASVLLTACGSGDDLKPPANPATPNQAGLSGHVTYDQVPTATRTDSGGSLAARLDYANIKRLPVRNALVEAVSADGQSVLGQTSTDQSGAYSIALPQGTRAYVRVTAQSKSGSDATPDYSFTVRDNTSPEFAASASSAPAYSMRGAVVEVTNTGTQVDLNAGSGWTGSGYGAPRTAGPFVILDQIVTAAQKMRTARPDVALPPLSIFWSVNNRPTEGEDAKGYIGTSHYDPNQDKLGLYILGAENVDTDEYDNSVMIHEFGHYVEYALSRSDSLGGTHVAGDALDFRGAFGEAWGNAFSSMMRDTPLYTDTVGAQQQDSGVTMMLDAVPSASRKAWFDELAVGNFLYGLYKSPDVGFANIYDAMITGQKATPALTSVFSFATSLRPSLSDAGKAVLDQSLADIAVVGGAALDSWGTATTKGVDATVSTVPFVPVYVALPLNGTAQACTTTEFGVTNKLGVSQHMRVVIPSAGKYRISSPAFGGSIKYAMQMYRIGKEIELTPDAGNARLFNAPEPGDYVLDISREQDSGANAKTSPDVHCLNLSLQAANP